MLENLKSTNLFLKIFRENSTRRNPSQNYIPPTLSNDNYHNGVQLGDNTNNLGRGNAMNEEFLGFNNNYNQNMNQDPFDNFGMSNLTRNNQPGSPDNHGQFNNFGLIPEGMTEDEALMQAIQMSEQNPQH